MKKRISLIVVVILTLSLLWVSGINIAASIIETPSIPVTPTIITEVELKSDAGETVHGGTTVSFTTEINKLPKKGISSVELVYTYSESFEFNGNVTTAGLPEGWEISDYIDRNNTISFNVTDVSGENTVKNSFAIKFSFDVSMAPIPELYLKLSTVRLLDGDGNSIDVKILFDSLYIVADSVVPLFEHIGAALRINNTPALRFAMRVEKDDVYIKAMGTGKYSYSEGDNLKFGMLYIPENALTGELEIDTKGATKTIFKKAFTDNANEIVFAYTVENFSGNKTKFVTRPFVIYEGDDGEILYFYGEAKVRSASQVAEAELKSTTDTKKKNLLNKFI